MPAKTKRKKSAAKDSSEFASYTWMQAKLAELLKEHARRKMSRQEKLELASIWQGWADIVRAEIADQARFPIESYVCKLQLN